MAYCTKRLALDTRQHLAACVILLATTPWTFELGNQMNDAGIWIAPGLNFVFEILLAIVIYRRLARRSVATQSQ